MRFSGYIVVALALAAFLPAPSRAQAKKPPVPAPDYSTKYDRTPAGLIVQFQLIMTTAKDPDKTKLLVEELEIPKYDDYFDKVYQKDVSLFWTGSYTRALLRAAGEFQSLFARLGTEEGDFVIRRVDAAPTSKLEEALTSKMNGPVDVYAVSWKKRGAKDDSKNEELGYYVYYGNHFRWLYMLGYPKIPGETPKAAAAKPASGASKKAATGASATPAAKSNSTPSPASQQ